MRVPLSWLKEFTDTGDLSAEEIAERLSLQSVEAEVETFGVSIENVVYGKVCSLSPLPSDGSLFLVKVQIDKKRVIEVVTADSSLEEGMGVIVAPVGARVGETPIKERKFGKITSRGLLLSPQDLGLDDEEEGVLKLEGNLSPGTDASRILGFGEKILVLDITPNRGDLLSVRGLARDLSAIFGLSRKERSIPAFEQSGSLSIEIRDSDCGRYRGVALSGVRIARSPLWMRVRLWQAGVRTINNVVDVTNYILLQEGQPLHAFDLKTLEGGVVVRSAEEGERIITLDGEERRLNREILIIADERKPIAVAGVIGGMETSVNPSTTEILLEAAYFNPARVRKGSKLLGLRTESSYRFERNTDLEWLPKAQDLAVDLILRTAGGKVVALRDLYPEKYTARRIFLSAGKFVKYAGEEFKAEEVGDILSSLEIPCTVKECGIEVFVPSHRSFDLKRDVDLVEEIMRVKGYEAYPSRRPSLPLEGEFWTDKTLEIRKYLRDKGLSEVINISYEDEELYRILGLPAPSTEILNPLIPSQKFMRSSLIPSLIRTALYNESHYNHDIGIFELGRVFTDDNEEERVGILLKGVRSQYPHREWEAYDLSEIVQGIAELVGVKADFEETSPSFLHPHIRSSVLVEGERAGFMGRLHPRIEKSLGLKGKVYIAEISLKPLIRDRLPHYSPISRYPPAVRDLSLSVDKNLPVSKLLNEIKSHLGEKAEGIMVFDLYTGEKVGEGKKSVGVRVVFRSSEGSLSGEEVNALVSDLVRRLRELLGVEIR